VLQGTAKVDSGCPHVTKTTVSCAQHFLKHTWNRFSDMVNQLHISFS
jgi:hypothetical protein